MSQSVSGHFPVYQKFNRLLIEMNSWNSLREFPRPQCKGLGVLEITDRHTSTPKVFPGRQAANDFNNHQKTDNDWKI